MECLDDIVVWGKIDELYWFMGVSCEYIKDLKVDRVLEFFFFLLNLVVGGNWFFWFRFFLRFFGENGGGIIFDVGFED